MKKKLMVLATAGAVALFLAGVDVSAAAQGRQAGERSGHQVQARDGRGDQAGQGAGEGEYRKGDGRGNGWHRDETGSRAGDRERKLNCK